MGFEPTTSAVTGRRSNQLSHRAKIIQIEWTFRDLNPGPIGYEPDELPTAPLRDIIVILHGAEDRNRTGTGV